LDAVRQHGERPTGVKFISDSDNIFLAHYTHFLDKRP
jgi:hypothetical protein